VGKPVTLHTFHYLEGQLGGSNLVPRLIGFATTGERRFFDLLTSVDGLGNRKALKALAHEPAEIARAIAGADTGWLVKLPEIGKKTAEKVILELKGKVSGYLSDSTLSALDAASRGVGPAASSDPPAVADAIEALITLGETRPDAERKIRAAALRKPAAKTPDELVAAAYGA
jgi:Holliday junction DNA helicase RuvA